MAEYVPFCDDMKTMGRFIVHQLQCMGPYAPFAERFLAARGIVEPEMDGWYDIEPLLQVFKDMAERFGSNTVVMIGKKMGELAPFPPDIKSIEDGLVALTQAYSMVHKGTDIGGDLFTKTGDRSGFTVCHNPYSCDWNRGAIMSVAERFKQPGQDPKVVHDDSKPCRRKGGDSCTYLITW